MATFGVINTASQGDTFYQGMVKDAANWALVEAGLPVLNGGTGAVTLTDHGILLGSGTSAVTPLGAATNGQLPIGSTGADPVLAAITGTASQIAVTNGAGSITLSLNTIIITKVVSIQVVEGATSCATGDGKAYFRVPSTLNGMNLVGVAAAVVTAGTTGTQDIQIANVTQSADMLSTKITIDSAETDSSTAATPAVIDTGNDDVATGDMLRIDVDAVHSGTAAKGLCVELQFRL